MGIKIVPKKKKKGGRATSNKDVKKKDESKLGIIELSGENLEEAKGSGIVLQKYGKKKGRRLGRSVSHADKTRLRRGESQTSVLAPKDIRPRHLIMSGSELTRGKAKGGSVKKYARGGGVRAARF